MRWNLLLLMVLAGACDRSVAGTPGRPPATDPAPTVDVTPVSSQRLQTTVRLPGELAPYEVVALFPRINAFVEEVLVDRGSIVRKGQLLLRLSAPELTAQRAEAQAKLIGLQSTYDRTRAAASTPGAVAKHDLEVSEAAAKAEAAHLEALKTLEGYLAVRAPFAGTVTERNVHPGALVGPAQGGNALPMLRVESVQRLRLTVAVPESEVGAIADGATAEFVARTWPGERFTGTIRRVAHAVEPRTRTMPVELDVDNHAGKLAPGIYTEVRWPVRRAAPSLFVPTSAIVQTPNQTFVDRVRDGVVERVPIERGTVIKDRTEVFGGLGPGDLVLRRGSEELSSGARVNARTVPAGGGT